MHHRHTQRIVPWWIILCTGVLWIVGVAPLCADSFDTNISSSSDDAEEDNGGDVKLSNSKIELGQMDWCGFRFTNVTIPQAATITSAYIRFRSEDNNSENTDLTIFGHDTDDSSTFSDSGSNDLSGRSRTSASVSWANVENWSKNNYHNSPDITTIIQEIVARPGWSSGNDLSILIRSDDDSGKRLVWPRDHNTTHSPRLYIEYTPDGEGGGADPTDTILLVVKPGSMTSQDSAKRSLIESWGYSVTTIEANDSQSNFDTAVASAVAAYVSEEISSSQLGTKLKDATIGVVNGEQNQTDEFGFSSGAGTFTDDQIDITDNSHYITEVFSMGTLTITDSNEPLHTATGTIGSGVQTLAEQPSNSNRVLLVLETGAALYGGGTAAGRRVHLPWGRGSFDINELNADGQTLMRRALEWASGAGEVSTPVFTDVSSSTGFAVQSTSSNNAGWHWADVDNDGDLDAISTGNQAKFFLNNNEGASFFTSTFGGGSVVRQAAFLDLDNDGDMDFFGTPTYYTEDFWLNDGSGGFTSQGNLGFGSPDNNEGVAAADVNLDGLCDIVMFSENGNWIGFNEGGTPPALNDTNASSYGLNDSGDEGNGDFCSSGDVNGDGRLDFFYHYNSGKLFLSDGDGTYTQSNGGISVTTGNSDKMGSAWADYDNDGDLDLFVCRYDSGQRGYLWQNTGGTFSNVALAAGIDNTDNQISCAWGDYDNDGDLDLYITTQDDGNLLYRNNGDGSFSTVSSVVNVDDDCHDACFVDYDNDGDLDLSLVIEDTTNRLFRNETDDTNYLKVRVIGAGLGATNTAGVGVRIDLYDASGTTFLQRRDIGVARGFAGSEPLWAHFGGVDPATTYTVRVYFVSGMVDTTVVPSSVSTTIGSTTISQMLTVEEPPVNEDLRVIRWVEVDPNN